MRALTLFFMRSSIFKSSNSVWISSITLRNYLDWIISLPWNIKTEDIIDIKHAEEVLNKDHYGLEKPKERILEFLSVRKYSDNMKGSIICFVGFSSFSALSFTISGISISFIFCSISSISAL